MAVIGGANVANRWWVYQRERFPILAHGPLIAAFSLSAVCCSSLLRGDVRLPSAATAIAATATALLFFLQLRIADEFKDFEEDSRYRPYRPVPRGLVNLCELGILGLLAAAVQLSLACLWQPGMIPLLCLVWLYLALMSKELFIGKWLKAHPILYMLSHMVIVPLIDLCTTAWDWQRAGEGAPPGLCWFLAVSYVNGIVLEIGRKLRVPADEEQGVETYSALWGRRSAVFAWLGALLVTAAFAALAAHQIDFAFPVVGLVVVLLLAAVWTARLFLHHPVAGRGRWIEALSGVWTLLLYLNLGAVPLLWRWWTWDGATPS